MMPDEPVIHEPVIHDPDEERAADADERRVEEGIGLCLSGGGYRAMLFHVGALWRLNQAGMLREVKRISSVSGGSITAGVLGTNWQHLNFGRDGVAMGFEDQVVAPIRKLAAKTIDRGAVLGGVLLPGSVSDRVAGSYRKVLFGDSTLQDLPSDADGPRFVFNATNLQSGVLWRFSKPYMADYKVGRVDEPTVPLATVVAASSAFPPVLSPVELSVDPTEFTVASKDWALSDLQSVGEVVLSDGGVYDNLGLETVWKRYKTVLVSDGGGRLAAEQSVDRDWARHSIRVMMVIDSQVRSLRKRQIIGGFVNGDRTGTYWGIGSDQADYGLADPLPADPRTAGEIAATPTRLKRLKKRAQKRLINWGFIISDTALRKWVRPDLPKPDGIPYPEESLGG